MQLYFNKKQHNQDFSELEIVDIANQILQGLCYLHSKHIIHRDIKLQNILISEDFTIKIADFDLSKMNKDILVSSILILM